MQQSLYIRMRGRVQGPLDIEKVRLLVQRGQLSRSHQISFDGKDWRTAGEFPDLFPPIDTKAESSNRKKSSNADTGYKLEAPTASGGEGWYYEHANTQNGPVSLSSLQQLIASGRVQAAALVWKEGLANWVPASSMPEFAGKVTGSPRPDVQASSDYSDLARTLSDSRSWLICIAVCLFLGGAIELVLGAVTVVLGAKYSSTPTMVSGFASVVGAGVCFWAGQLMASSILRIGKYLQQPRQNRLDAVLRSYRAVWVFTSILLIIGYVLGLAALIISLSAGISLAPS
ncbi:hypothetical protein Pla108_14080 [Botrimarina colliarenosi]|uniref:GYF domain-containing protein n=1 Tax=Botrimarina colliarenosi TaxID=2528001 RepID=A0A5C6ALW2_9BACT|nr:GYF domain-containing protein [Botrimarina colliarenosi]TWU00457.1 hypothetical protein Pla108_14080 [Botrimarina colliarenosi]